MKGAGVGSESGPKPFGPFVLERRLAVGGMAEVFHARPRSGERPARQLVIKRLHRRDDGESHFAALSREAELNCAVTHPNVVQVFGAGMVGNEAYLAMEYVDGVDLHRLMRVLSAEGKKLPPALAVYVARSVADALHAVHTARDTQGRQLNIRHGDVSPSNVYLSRDGDVKLGDFGLAHSGWPVEGERAGVGTPARKRKMEAGAGPRRLASSERALPAGRGSGSDPRGNDIKGKFGYLAPEQLVGERVDHRADVFALGVVLGELLIGQRVFPGSGQLAVLLSIREANIEPLRRAAKDFSEALFDVCARALERDVKARFTSAGELSAALVPLENPAQGRALLAEHVRAARDSRVLEEQLAASAQRGGSGPRAALAPRISSVRRGERVIYEDLPFAKLLELAATGQVNLDDEVSLMGETFRRVEQIEELARHLLPSTTTTTSKLFRPGVPDFNANLYETSVLAVLARMRMRRETGALFVSRFSRGLPERKDLYLKAGRLLYVASSNPEELLGHYCVSLGLISAIDLERALEKLSTYGGRLGETLVGLGLVDSMELFRAIQNQGRDRVAALCAWGEGQVQLYRGAEPGEVQFPLDLDLAVPMLAGALRAARQGSDPLVHATRLSPGRALEQARRDVSADLPAPLLRLLELVEPELPLARVIAALAEPALDGADDDDDAERRARAALVVASALQWVRFE
jgi:serine/threonine protein kinase